jgi:hypothetical protein
MKRQLHNLQEENAKLLSVRTSISGKESEYKRIEEI